ncbi:sensor histidine kinase [Ornithinibacillus halotolerans]|uniref:histidine kinase n=1 Tax=Ornithinibacillus halotolerans TaxID=1274357 RepID=A0A916S5J9_9BACI|nr:sensor histidine kinase [Ornithinibacillus halotolerans]GGA85576.1 histidine kinase [Ornithinibacillus halotolerans]
MKYFWIRFLIFVALWVFMILTYSNQVGLSILFFSAAIGVFFFFSLQHVSIYLYLLLTVIIVLHGILLTDNYLFPILLLLFESIIASYRMNGNRLILFLSVQLILSIGFIYAQSEQIGFFLLVMMAYYIIFTMNQQRAELLEQRQMYEELVGEYRKLKRINLLNEENVRTEERNRIARDIHDSVGHRLTALIMKLEMLAIQTKNDEYRALKHMAEESLGETRQAVKALQQADNEGIATVVNLIRKLEAQSQMVVQFTIKQGALTVPLLNHHSVVLYRVIQEALTNAMRHGESREVQVIIGKSPIGDITFEIMNAIYKARPYEEGFGLTGMRKRVQEVQGRLDVYQKENKFIVSGIIPAGEGG